MVANRALIIIFHCRPGIHKHSNCCGKYAVDAIVLNIIHLNGLVAQSVEQRTENPCVAGSIPVQATSLKTRTDLKVRVFFFIPHPTSILTFGCGYILCGFHPLIWEQVRKIKRQ
jgi:hypothetical protein